MASQRLQRYLAVQKAKGLAPNPLELSRLLKEDVSESIPPERNQIVERRKEMLSGGGGEISGTLGSPDSGVADPTGPTSLGSTIGAELAGPTLGAMAGKAGLNAAIGAVTGVQMGVNPAVTALGMAAHSLASPISMALAFGKLGLSSVAGMTIGTSIASAFGNEAAQEALGALSGQISPEALSAKGMSAFANAKVAMAYAKQKGLIQTITNPLPLTSLVTPYHTNEQISEAFGVSPPSSPPSMFGSEVYGSSMQGMHGALAAASASGGMSWGGHAPGGSLGPPGTPGAAGMDAGPGGGSGGGGASGSGPGGYGGGSPH